MNADPDDSAELDKFFNIMMNFGFIKHGPIHKEIENYFLYKWQNSKTEGLDNEEDMAMLD